MSDIEDTMDPEPPIIDPYEVLELERDATPDQIKSAYRKAALKNHPGTTHAIGSPTRCRYSLVTYKSHPTQINNNPSPPTDKVPESQKAQAHTTFQRIALAHAVLSDPARRRRYDATGSTSESLVDGDGFDWTEYYRAAYADAVSADAIQRFADSYKGSDEERDDVLVAYERHKGDMDAVYETVMLSSVLEDDARFRAIIDEAIESGDIKGYKAYTKESARAREARTKAAREEAGEAEEYAKELGVHDKLFGRGKGSGTKGKGKGKGKGKENSEAALAALIMGKQRERGESFLDALAEKYGGSAGSAKKKGKKGKQPDEEPDEEAFQAAAARLGKGKKKASEEPAPKASKRARR